jgi:hypothetical protein
MYLFSDSGCGNFPSGFRFNSRNWTKCRFTGFKHGAAGTLVAGQMDEADVMCLL